MDISVDLINQLLSIVSSLIFALCMCRALSMRSNVGYVAANIIVNVAYVAAFALGVSKATLFVLFTGLIALVLPLTFGAEPRIRCAIKGVVGSLVYMVFGVLAEVLVMAAMGASLTEETLASMPLSLLLLIYLAEWPIFALALEGYARVCRRLEGHLSDVSLAPAVGYFAIGIALCMVNLSLNFGLHGEGVAAEFQLFAVFAAFYVAYMAVLGAMLWRHAVYVRSRRVLRQRQLLDMQLKVVQADYDKLVAAQDRLRRIRHDIANHLQVSQTLVQRGETDRAAEHLQALRNALHGLRSEDMPDQDNPEVALEPAMGDDAFEDEEGTPLSGRALDGRTALLPMAAAAFIPQVVMIAEIYYGTQSTDNAWFGLPAAVLAGVLCLAADVALVWMAHKKEQVIGQAQRASCMAETREALLRFRQSAQDQRQLAESVLTQVEEALDQAEQGLRSSDLGSAHRALCQGMAKIDAAGSRVCDNAVASAVVCMERDCCRERGVDFECDLRISDTAPLPQTQLAAVLFNLLDNAIRAAEQEGPADRRWVSIKAGIANGNFVIDVQNACSKKLNGPIEVDAAPRDRLGLHGWGLGNVALIARDCNGMASFSAKEGVFSATFVIFSGFDVTSRS